MKGFLAGGALYGAIGAAAVVGALTVALTIQGYKLRAVKAEFEACRGANAVLNEQIARQNEAVKDLERAAEDRQKRAAKALEAARKGEAKARSEAARLKAAKPAVGAPCPAGQAVQRVREGIR